MNLPRRTAGKFVSARRLLVTLTAAWLWASPVEAATLVVNNANASGAGSLRQALLDANTNANLDTITFNIPGTGVKTITPTAALPQVEYPVIIDGTTQPGYAGLPLIQITGTSAGSANGLLLLGGGCVVRGLVINRFELSGIRIEAYGSNVIERVFLGSDPTGTLARPNTVYGLAIVNSPGNRIGGSTGNVANLISSNGVAGIFINGAAATGNRIEGNFIGTDLTGRLPLGNAANGIHVLAAPENWIGGTNAGSGNVVSGNRQSGIYINGIGSTGNLVVRNIVGPGVDGTNALPNQQDGITVISSPANRIGLPGHGNLVSGNLSGGITLSGSSALTNVVQGNLVGTDITGQRALGNSRSGITLNGVRNSLIGGTAPGEGNLVSGNGESGIRLVDSFTTENYVLGNRCGTDLYGTNAIPNTLHGISIAGPNNFIGGTVPGAGNVASGNNQAGIYIGSATATGNVVRGNRVGVTADGKSRRGNFMVGLMVDGAGTNYIGGRTPGAGNVISGNSGSGLLLASPGCTGNRIEGNLIGTDLTGTLNLGNGGDGLGISNAPGNFVGGPALGQGNLVSGNNLTGVWISGTPASNNVVAGNFIGTDLAGRKSIPNQNPGIHVSAPRAVIGGTQPGARNIVSGNNNVAISIRNTLSVDTLVQGNWVGLQADGYSPLSNLWHGVEVRDSATRTTIGGTASGAANRIAYAQTPLYTGVRIRDGCNSNSIRGNLIFNNPGLGIDLGVSGVNTNRTGSGPGLLANANMYQNYPVLSSATNRFRTIVKGTLNSVSNQTFTVDFYANNPADASGYGEGRLWLGAVPVTTSAAGSGSFTATFTNTVAITGVITATATDIYGNTSEFAANIPLSTGPIVDSDSDGIPDDYELAWGLNPNNPADANLDTDGDGVSNLKEYLAGTNPRDATDYLRIASTYAAGSNTWVSFDSRWGRTYTLQRASDLSLRPELLPVRATATNNFGVRLRGSAGQGLILDASTNFTTWLPVATNGVTSGDFVYYEPPGTPGPRRYYRARVPAWINVATNLPGFGGSLWIADTNRALPTAFYRLRCDP